VPSTPSASTSTSHRPLASFNTPASMSARAQHACLLQRTADDSGSPVHLGSALQTLDAHTKAGSETACRGRDGSRGGRCSSCKGGLARRHWRQCRHVTHLSLNKIDRAYTYLTRDGCAVDSIRIHLNQPSSACFVQHTCINVSTSTACLPAATHRRWRQLSLEWQHCSTL